MAKVLIIEDDQFLSKMYLKKFQISGFEVETASDGEEGLKKVISFMPDIILLDIMLPKMNGMQILKAVKQDEKLKKIPVIIMTNLSGTEDAGAAMKMGALEYLIKSELTPAEVVEIVKKTLAL